MKQEKNFQSQSSKKAHMNKKIVVVFLIIAIIVFVGSILLSNYPVLSEFWFIGLMLFLGTLGVGGGYVFSMLSELR